MTTINLGKTKKIKGKTQDHAKLCIRTIAKLLYPITPHISFSVLSALKIDEACNPQWPEKIKGVDDNKEVQIIIQINGKLRSKIITQSGLKEDEVLKIVHKDQKSKEYLDNSNILKIIYVPDKLINFVIK